MKTIRSQPQRRELVREICNGDIYEYFPLGEHIVAAPGVCGGRPTFRYTRLEVSTILALIAAGESVQQVAQAYSLSRLTSEAIKEAVHLADQALVRSVQMLPVAA
ncbi:MAG: DUF433 domain-containing protein [Chloroflexi bacterium]|nr:DUF433 domain-containing protein [Chloroflexota bacterium]